MLITRTRVASAVAALVATVMTPMLTAGPAAATYDGNDGRLYFGAFDPAQRRSADLYSTHMNGDDLKKLTEAGATPGHLPRGVGGRQAGRAVQRPDRQLRDLDDGRQRQLARPAHVPRRVLDLPRFLPNR